MATSATGDPAETVALRYLAVRDRTEAQLAAFLARKGVASTRIARLLSRFRAQGYLHDARYAERWARLRLARAPMGRARLIRELTAKGLPDAVVRATADRLYAETSEAECARRLLARVPDSPQVLRRHGFWEETIETVCRGETVCPGEAVCRVRRCPEAQTGGMILQHERATDSDAHVP